ncbi:unnamed protein product [Peronospora farinosa]|uniref:ATP synthase F1 complex delta/epsilon subunit N-terminal domain-containing protein n=1 Tax=Peronospora farinosa TaxID=134698 RepID=A0ABN8BUL0_9STRA|nr:unnamed protein product [Peronospora farinosa]
MMSTSTRRVVRALHTSSRLLAPAATAATATDQVSTSSSTKVTLNLTTPYQAFYKSAEVDLVQIPGVIGEYGVTAGHTPVLAQLKPGVIKVHVEREKDVQSFFTAGGFALTHANSVTDIACVELVKVEDIDPEAAQAGLIKYQTQLASAPEGSEEKLHAQIGVDTHAAMVAAVVSN